MTRRPIPKARLVANESERSRAVLLQARIYAASSELIKLVGATDGYWPEWEDQNEAIRNEAADLKASGAQLWGIE